MIEIVGTLISETEALGALVGAVVGAVLTGYALYVVAKVKHDRDVQDAVNEAALAGEKYPEWRIEKAGKWYKGYKLALVECIALAILTGLCAVIFTIHAGYSHGCVEAGAVALVAAAIGGYVWDIKIIHPIADGKFLEDVEQPLVDKFLGVVEDVDPALLEKAKELRDKGII